MDIDAPAAAMHEMERQMRINEDVLRFLTIAVEEHEEGPSAMMQKRDRDDRPRRDGDDRGPRRDFGEVRGDRRRSSVTVVAIAARVDRANRS
jgi:small subunit ribosomal protein S6